MNVQPCWTLSGLQWQEPGAGDASVALTHTSCCCPPPRPQVCLFLANLRGDTETDEGLRAECEQYGSFERCFVMRNAAGDSKHYAFCEFTLPSGAAACKEAWTKAGDAQRPQRDASGTGALALPACRGAGILGVPQMPLACLTHPAQLPPAHRLIILGHKPPLPPLLPPACPPAATLAHPPSHPTSRHHQQASASLYGSSCSERRQPPSRVWRACLPPPCMLTTCHRWVGGSDAHVHGAMLGLRATACSCKLSVCSGSFADADTPRLH